MGGGDQVRARLHFVRWQEVQWADREAAKFFAERVRELSLQDVCVYFMENIKLC